MKAVVYERYGPPEVVTLGEVARPNVGDSAVLVKVRATSVTTADWRLRASAFPGIMWLPGRLMFGLFRPRNRILGGEFAGEVEAIGRAVTRFAPGDRVFGFCGTGAHAEYVAMAETAAITALPEGLGFDKAAALPFGGLAALVFLRDFAKLRRGERVLVVGASGGVGCYVVQLARHFGAEVTGVCGTDNVAFVLGLGAAEVVDYTVEDFTTSGRTYDVIIDTVGTTTFGRCRASLSEGGRFVPLNFGLREAFQALASSIGGGRKVVIGVNGDTCEDLEQLRALVEAGALRPDVARRSARARIVDAYRYVEARHRKGAVVVTVAER
jgi:NADPH:quinone reductase-like Zn-dependent oxidoreductase